MTKAVYDMTPSQAAMALGVTEAAVWGYAKRGLIKSVLVPVRGFQKGRRYRSREVNALKRKMAKGVA